MIQNVLLFMFVFASHGCRYGIADTRDKSDAEVIQAILNITDSRYQKQLLAR